ncbi:MAG: hypothetical protein IPP44_08070 [Ideonella sp.]|nr:hypothetical protein [Ideonella sp.]
MAAISRRAGHPALCAQALAFGGAGRRGVHRFVFDRCGLDPRAGGQRGALRETSVLFAAVLGTPVMVGEVMALRLA